MFNTDTPTSVASVHNSGVSALLPPIILSCLFQDGLLLITTGSEIKTLQINHFCGVGFNILRLDFTLPVRDLGNNIITRF